MAFKMHCDICDAVMPEDQEYVYLVRKSDYHNRDWKSSGPPVGCYPCLESVLAHVPERVL